MNIFVMGHVLLGFLAVVALLVNVQLVRLGRRHRHHTQRLTPFVVSLLVWLPYAAVVIVVGGVALGETSLLNYQHGQDVGGLSWFVVGACLSIFADLCAAMTLITLSEALKVINAADDLETALAAFTPQEPPRVIEQDEQ